MEVLDLPGPSQYYQERLVCRNGKRVVEVVCGDSKSVGLSLNSRRRSVGGRRTGLRPTGDGL